jgi:hypothetical protein
MLQSTTSNTFIGNIDNMPKMVTPEHAYTFDIRTNSEHESSLCIQEKCLLTDDLFHLSFSKKHSTKFLVIENEDGTFSFIHKKNCIVEKGVNVVIDECGSLPDKFKKVFPGEKNKNEDNNEDPNKNKNTKEGDIIFNYGIEDTDHKRDSIIKMRKEDENYTLIPRNRHHNSHTHRVGGYGDKAYYTYFSYHPGSRHSAYNFHSTHHGIPKSWADDEQTMPFMNMI